MKCIAATAERMAAINDLYTLREPYDQNKQAIDDGWTRYEAKLAPAIKKLTAGTIDAKEWAGVLVPFVAGLFVRGPDFNRRFDARAEERNASRFKQELSVDNTNYARALEIQRLLAPILSAKWIISKAPEKDAFITTDLAFGIFQDPDDQIGMAIPLDRQHVLQLIPRRVGEVAIAGEHKWYPILEHRTLLAGNFAQLNQTIASTPARFIYGADKKTLMPYLKPIKADLPLLEPNEIGFLSGPLAAVHEFTWHQYVTAVSHLPGNNGPSFDIDWGTVAEVWKPPFVFFPTNLPEFPSPLYRLGNMIWINLYDVEGFPSAEITPEPIPRPEPQRQ